MQVLKLLRDNNFKLKQELDKEVGAGADGQCFILKNNLNKVIKLSVLFQESEKDFVDISNTLNFLIKNKISIFATVHEFDFLFSGSRKTVSGDQKFIIYYYIMDRCLKISDDEYKVFHSIISHEDRGIGYKKNFSLEKISSMLDGMAKALDFNKSKVMHFCSELLKSAVDHSDLHTRNIMKTKDNNYLLIDFDRSRIRSF